RGVGASDAELAVAVALAFVHAAALRAGTMRHIGIHIAADGEAEPLELREVTRLALALACLVAAIAVDAEVADALLVGAPYRCIGLLAHAGPGRASAAAVAAVGATSAVGVTCPAWAPRVAPASGAAHAACAACAARAAHAPGAACSSHAPRAPCAP